MKIAEVCPYGGILFFVHAHIITAPEELNVT